MRLREAQELVGKEGLDAFLFSAPPSVFYLSGFSSTHAYVVLTPSSKFLLTDSRYYLRARRELPDWEVVEIKGTGTRFLKRFLKEKGVRRVGYESDRVSCEFRRKLRSRGIRWVPRPGFLRNLRAVKTREEIEILREGVRKSDGVYRELLRLIEPGMTELEVRSRIVEGMFRAGARGESFPTIVASGPASAVPHWETSEERIRENAPLLIDMGLLWKGYCTDFTRTLYVGRPDPEFVKVYTVVRDAHLFALEKVKVGVRIGDIDRAARSYISKKRLGRFFTHSTGHGVGVEIHEHPRIYHRGESASEVVEEGMVFTLEPGVYLPGRFGVRLENMVAVVGGRGEPLSEVPLDLVSL